jgi:CRISPR-associated protein Csy2
MVEMIQPLEDLYEALGREDILDENRQDAEFIAYIERAVATSRLAGGSCVGYDQVALVSAVGDVDEIERKLKRTLYGLLPGFAIIDRSELLHQHMEQLKSRGPVNEIEAWMDFAALRYEWIEQDSQESTGDSDDVAGEWQRVPLPENGWFVPLMLGYQPITSLQSAGTVQGSRDPDCPVCPVEAVYGVGQWLAPFRVASVDELLWRYSYCEDGYQFQNVSMANTVELEK